MKLTSIIATAMTGSILAACQGGTGRIAYPEAPSDGTVDTIFRLTVNDIYRPLENDTAPATLEWVEAENRITNDYLGKIPFRKGISDRLTTLNNYVKRTLPERGNDGKYYYGENDGLKNQYVIYRTDNPSDTAREVFLDPNTLSDDGTVALGGTYQSKDGKYTAYAVSRSGSDWTEFFVMDTESKELLPDHIEWAKFSDAVWDGDGFYYSAYPAPAEGKEFSNANEDHRVYYHRLGTPQADDKVIFNDPANPLHFHHAVMTSTQPELFVTIGGQGVGNAIKMRRGNSWVDVAPDQDYRTEIVDVIDGKIYLLTTFGADRKRLMTADIKNPGRDNWREVIPESDGVLRSVSHVGDKFYAIVQKDATDHIMIYNLDGTPAGEIGLPILGSVALSTSTRHPESTYYSLSSFTSPATIYHYDPATGKSEIVFRPEIEGFDFDDYVTEQVFYPSADGTKIPMFLTYRKGLERDGKNPVYLYGYGGFNISLPPAFSPNRLFMLENGVIYAQTNLRGGSEYGEAWHQAGTQMNKQNVFDDFIAAAEYMIGQGWTSPDYITIEGGSNGGLLVGAVVNQRPDLYKVAFPRVGVMDMMRYHLFTIGWNWAPDYGTSADSPEMAKYLLGYSPLHTIRNDGTPYPAIMVTTADHDDRVVPAHSFKYAAALQAADTGDAPKLIRIDTKAGHGAGKPTAKVIEEYTDIYSFMFHNLGVTPHTAAE